VEVVDEPFNNSSEEQNGNNGNKKGNVPDTIRKPGRVGKGESEA
jgi:hypothetical protein